MATNNAPPVVGAEQRVRTLDVPIRNPLVDQPVRTADRQSTAPPRVFVREESVARRAVRLRGVPTLGKPLGIGYVEIWHAETGLWLANVSQLLSIFPTNIRINHLHLKALHPDRGLFIAAAEQFRSDVHDGKVKPCQE